MHPNWIRLKNAVCRFDPLAADKLEELENSPFSDHIDFTATSVNMAFSWGATPQGHAYWHNIDRKVGILDNGPTVDEG